MKTRLFTLGTLLLSVTLLVSLIHGEVQSIAAGPMTVQQNAPFGQIAFVSDRDGDLEIYTMNVDGTGLTKLTSNEANDEGPSWSPDGSKIVFHSDRGGYSQIYIMNADGSSETRLLITTVWDHYAYWSPDGTRIAFCRWADHSGSGDYRTEVYVMDADGTNVKRLTYNSGQSGGYPHEAWSSGWSPDSSKILFYRYRDLDEQLWIMNADGSNQQQLTSGTYWNAIPTMSPDGTRIAFASYRDWDFEIYVMNADGTNQTRLTYTPGEDWRPTWSQDGSKLLFESSRDGRKQIYWMNPDGSQQTRLTDNTASDTQPCWRPGGEPGPTPTRPPVILVHGWQILGTTRYCSDGVKHLAPGVSHTFGEMAQWFVEAGYDVWIANLDSGPLHTPTIEENAQCLKEQVAKVRQQTGQEVTLIGHSMGGLVSRACLSLDDCQNNVETFYSLGSPHAGINTALLLKLLAHLKAPVVAPIAEEMVCQWQPVLCQFSTERIVVFNSDNPNQNGIDYTFIGGSKTPLPFGLLFLPFDGPNDGLVGAYSAVGWLYPTKLNVVLGPEASRYWTNEAHTSGFGSPTYFEPSGGPESEAFRCIAWGDCLKADGVVLSAAQTEPTLSATTVDVIGHLASGQSVSHTLQVDTSNHSLFYLSWLTGTLSFTITQPDGQVITPAYAEAHQDVVTYTTGLGDYVISPFAVYAFTNTLPGHYIVTISADEVGSEGTGYLAFAALETDRTFAVSTDAELYQVGDTVLLSGTLQGSLGGITGADVQVRFTRMDGITDTLVLTDLGGGIYRTLYIVPDAPGYLQATFTALGDDDGTAFNRQVDELLTIAPYAAQLSGTYADQPEDKDGDGFNDILAVDVGVTTTKVNTYTLSADLVAEGQTVAHTLEYTVLTSGTQTITLGFDGWDIRRSQSSGPYTVTHVSLVDLGVGGIPAQMADDVWVTAPYKWQDFGFERLYLPLIIRSH